MLINSSKCLLRCQVSGDGVTFCLRIVTGGFFTGPAVLFFFQLMVYYLLNVSYGTNTRCWADKGTLALEIALTVAGLRSLED